MSMYPNILLSILILLVAFEIIGAMLRSDKMIRAAGVGMVLLVAAVLILWLLMGFSPIPPWFTKLIGRILHSVQSAKF